MHSNVVNTWMSSLGLLGLLVSGCYSGLDGQAGEGSADGSGTAASQGDDSDGGDNEGDEDGQDDGGIAATCVPASVRMWKLTPIQIERTLESLIPGSGIYAEDLNRSLPDTKQFSNEAEHLDMPQPHVEKLFDAAGQVADFALVDPVVLDPCFANGMDAPGCATTFLQDFARRAYRRPLEAEEADRLAVFYEAQRDQQEADVALQQSLRAVLMSPHFLYRSELGAAGSEGDVIELTPYEKAQALSYLLTDGPPDADLLAAAADDALSTPEQIEAHTRRLLEGGAEAEGLVQFFFEQYGLERIDGALKDEELFPEFGDAVVEDMLTEGRSFIRHVLFEDDARFETLMTAPYTIANARLAALYGVEGPAGDDQFEWVALPADQRSGIMTQLGVMAGLARTDETDIVLRGRFVREELLCGKLPPPPADVNAFPPPPDPDMTHRERMEQHVADPACSGCHNLMDPLGFAFEHYNAMGVWQDLDNGKPVDASGFIEAVQLDDNTFDDAIGLTRKLAVLPEAQACFVDRLHQYASGRYPDTQDECARQALYDAFIAADGDVIELMVALTTAEGFFIRNRT